MTKYERKQQDAKNECIKLILDNETMDMVQVHRLLSCILEENPQDVERASLVSLSALLLCRLPLNTLKLAYCFVRGE